ncbi:MAG TPA: hypothetical protein VMT46_19985 [Anaerolineaceae bacterium]|nr:hypothetical protein [Anaerolineaceae bacterium]
MRASICEKSGMLDESPVLITASIWPGSNPESASMSSTIVSMRCACMEPLRQSPREAGCTLVVIPGRVRCTSGRQKYRKIGWIKTIVLL